LLSFTSKPITTSASSPFDLCAVRPISITFSLDRG
jgi:hypothetical protein